MTLREPTRAAAPSAGEVSDAVARADLCDAAGKHAEAVNHLASAAARKDVEALTRLGKRLLVGDRAPLLPNDGARLLEEAVALGGGEAAAVIAVLYAAGVNKAHGVADAVDRLALAAERGWTPAQAQLQALAAPPSGAEPRDDPRSADWRALARRIDVDPWRRPPRGRDLATSPLVRLIPDFLSDRVCSWLIEKARGRLSPALVYDALLRKDAMRATRTNTAATLNLIDTDFVCVLTQLRIAACVGLPFRQLEPISILHYEPGEEITDHYDFVDPNVPDYEQQIASRGQRVITFLVYLNDEYGGGETEFPELAVSHKGRRGEGLFFVNSLPDGSADVRTLHAGRPPTGGNKWIVSQFIRNRPTL
jgi:hypothetical protein